MATNAMISCALTFCPVTKASINRRVYKAVVSDCWHPVFTPFNTFNLFEEKLVKQGKGPKGGNVLTCAGHDVSIGRKKHWRCEGLFGTLKGHCDLYADRVQFGTAAAVGSSKHV